MNERRDLFPVAPEEGGKEKEKGGLIKGERSLTGRKRGRRGPFDHFSGREGCRSFSVRKSEKSLVYQLLTFRKGGRRKGTGVPFDWG